VLITSYIDRHIQVTAPFDSTKTVAGLFGSEYERELFRLSIEWFLALFNKELSDWLLEKRAEFASKLLRSAANIQHDTMSLRDDLLHGDMNLHMLEAFSQTERRINEFATQVAAPLGIGFVAGGAGVGVPLLIGFTSTVAIASGALVLAGVAVTGILLHA